MRPTEMLENADPGPLAGFDEIIDVRSPAEFAEDHIPGAINLPVLNNDERARVGTIYVQESAFRARRIGAALVARNVAHHLETALAERPMGYRPLIYCWRGGQRSNAMATILGQIGWRPLVLNGGYKTYRRRVQARLYEQPLGLRLVLLEGGTGTGKTAVLQALAGLGVQTLDLEAMAEHRGSLFGGLPGHPQPTQKMFETRLLAAIERLDPARPVVVEAESRKVGMRSMPPALWTAMAAAPCIEISAPLDERAAFVARTYAELLDHPEKLRDIIGRLTPHIGRKPVEHLFAMAERGEATSLARDLIALHYDPTYAHARRGQTRPLIGSVNLSRLDAKGIEAGARRIAALIEQAETTTPPA